MNRSSPLLRAASLFCLVLLSLGQPLQAASGHEEFELREDPNLGLSALLDSTLAHHPEANLIEARRNTAAAETRYSDRWFPDTLQVDGLHLSDRSFDDIGARESEVALSFPLWLPGEKRAQSELGEAMTAAQASREKAFRWAVGGQLRKQLWTLKLARRQWELALEQEQRLEQMLDQADALAVAGDLARADQLAMLQELALWRSDTLELEAVYQDAVREYRVLSGGEVVPADISEQLSPKKEIEADHPALLMALDEVVAAGASVEVAWQAANVRPSVNVFWRGFRGDRTTPDVDALGLGFAVPLGRSPRRGPESARASEELARAEARLIDLKRKLDLALHEARHLLHTTELQLENSRVMVEAASERHRLDKAAFELGEFSLREWLRRLSQTREIERSHEILLIQQGAAVAVYNQAVGETP
ncbi:MAG: TolC family protein [Xanthomonadales bacterium]|nr:TolC family protein [Xanthomonadales bacterium]